MIFVVALGRILKHMMETFTNYLEGTKTNSNWIRNPFIADLESMVDEIHESMEDVDELKEQLMELKSRFYCRII